MMVLWFHNRYYFIILMMMIHIVPRQSKPVEFPSCTGRLRVCQNGEDPFHGNGGGQLYCSVNKLDRAPVILTGGAWWTSVYNMWIAQILLEEQLQVPVVIQNVNGGNTQLWQYDDGVMDVLDGRVYSWDALHLASNGSMDCSQGFRKIYAQEPEDLVNIGCVNDCLPCAHAMLEVWPNGQDVNYNKYVLKAQTVEDGGTLGAVGEVGWWATKSTVDANPLLSSFRGMKTVLGKNETQVFQRPVTFGEYCNLTYSEWQHIAADPDPFALKANIMSHFCQLFFENAILEEYGIAYSSLNHATYYELRYDVVRRCYNGTKISPTGKELPFYEICTQYWVVPEDLQDKLPNAATNLIRQGYFGYKYLFTGFFVPSDQGILQTTSCPDDPRLEASKGMQAWDKWDNMTLGYDGYSRFHNFDMDLIESHGLDLKPMNMHSDVRSVLEVSARLAIDNPNATSPVLISWTRPSSLFKRGDYDLKDLPWGGVNGSVFHLAKIQLPEYTETCEFSRRTYEDRCAVQTPFNVQTTSQCGYNSQSLYKVFASKLKGYAPEAYRFLRRFKLTRDEQEDILAAIDYDPYYRAMPPPTRSRAAVCDWIRNNTHIWQDWLPITSHKVRCLGEIGDPLGEENPELGGSVVECSGHGTCTSSAELLFFHPNAGECVCERGYVGDDCSGLVEPELLNVDYGDPLFIIVCVLQFFTSVLIFYLLHLLNKVRAKSTIFITSNPVYVKAILINLQLAVLGCTAWGGAPTVIHCITRPMFSFIPFGMVSACLYAKLNRKHMRVAFNTENLYEILYPLSVFYAGLFLSWFVMYFPEALKVRLPDQLWYNYGTCDYGKNQAAFEALLLTLTAYLIVMNCKLSFELRLKPTYFNEGEDMLRGSFFLGFFGPLVYLVGQILGSPKETEKYCFVTFSTLIMCWGFLYIVIRPKFHTHFYKPEINNMKDGLFYPTGNPVDAVGDPVLDMPRLLAEQGQRQTSSAAAQKPSVLKKKQMPPSKLQAFKARVTNILKGISTRRRGKGREAPVGIVPVDGRLESPKSHEEVYFQNIQEIATIEQFPSPEEEVLVDPHGMADISKRSLAYRSPEMYVTLERKIRILARENAELMKIIEEHRIDPITGQMDQDFMDQIHHIEMEHHAKLKAKQQEFEEELETLHKDRIDERNMLKHKHETTVRKLNEDKKNALYDYKVTQKKQERRLREMERETERLANTLRGTLPSLTTFLASYQFSEYEQGIRDQGMDSTEKLILASVEDLKEAGMRMGHIRKLQVILKSLEVSTPAVVMPDGAVKASLKRLDSHPIEDESKDDPPLMIDTKRKRPNNKQQRECAWIENKDPCTGKTYLIHPITGETKWDENKNNIMTEQVASDSEEEEGIVQEN